MLLSFDGTLLVQILNFVVFWVLLNYLFIAPTRRAIEARQQFIAEQYAQADALAAETRHLQAQADGFLDDARRTVDEAMRASAAQASDEAHAIERKASDEASATVARAHATVANERAQAIAKQGPFVDELARTMARRALSTEQVA
jgi:F-type H+-transporting ATPase subunit b